LRGGSGYRSFPNGGNLRFFFFEIPIQVKFALLWRPPMAGLWIAAAR